MTARTISAAIVFWISACLAASADAGFTVPPTPDHYVTDTAGALSASTKSKLESQLGAYEKATHHQVIVYIAQSTGDVPLESWTAETADTWKIGRKTQHDGVVLFLFLQDHKARIEVGYGLESALPDAEAKRIISHDIVPKMRAGDVDAAVSGAVGDILHTITPSFAGAVAPPNQTESSDDVPGWFVTLFLIALICVPIGFIVLIAFLIARSKKERFGKAMHDVWFWGGTAVGSGFSGSSWGGGGFGGGGGFSAGGGGFGGGGASGGW